VIWALQHDEWASKFDQVIELDEGRLVRVGLPPGAEEPEQAGARLLTAE